MLNRHSISNPYSRNTLLCAAFFCNFAGYRNIPTCTGMEVGIFQPVGWFSK